MNLQHAAVLLLATLSCAAGAQQAPYRAAVLADAGLPVRGSRTPVATFRTALAAEGVPLAALDAAAIADPSRFGANRFDLLIVPTGATFPAAARQTLIAFLKQGGDLLTTGGYAFDHLVERQGGRWVSSADVLARAEQAAADPARALVENGDFAAGTAAWSADGPSARVVQEGRAPYHAVAEVTSADERGGSRFAARLPAEPGRTYCVAADARTTAISGAGFGFLAVYQYDRAGALVAFRDFAQVRGTTPWRRYTAQIAVDPRADRVMFHAGVYLASGGIRFDRVTWAPVPTEVRINAHYGDPQDGLTLSPDQLTLFSPDQPLSGATLAAAPASGLPAGWRSPGPVRGFEATAQLRAVARWLPLVEARDRYGRPSGAAGALVRHGAGTFAGSQWALFGVDSRDIFAGEPGRALLRRVLRLLRSPARIDALQTDLAIYGPGETAAINATVAPNGPSSASAQVRLRLHTPEGRTLRTATVQAAVDGSGRTNATLAWPVPDGAPDFVQVSAELVIGGEVLDRAETGLCVYSRRVLRSGPRIAYRRNAFELQAPGKPVRRVLLNGTDTWSSMFHSPSHSPLTWYRDLQMMRDHGLHMYENLQFSPPGFEFSDAQWRQFDALIQLSQRFGLPYMAGLLIGQNVAVDDSVLAQQARMCGEFARRYKDVPGLIYYLNGDFRLDVTDTPDMRRLWEAYLLERYPDLDELRAVWGPGATRGAVPVPALEPGAWLDRRTQDAYAFRVRLLRRWVGALVQAIRAEDRAHPITSEYYQRPAGGIDLRLTLDGQDASNIGYFDAARVDIAKLAATIKWNDMRVAGKTVNLGEFGVKTHDAWGRERDPSGYHVARTEAGQRELFWHVVHAALAYDVTKIQNWCFADDPDTVFPWGVAWRNPLRAKPAFKLWRNLRVLSDRVGRVDRQSPVVLVLPDTWRQSAPEALAYAGLMNAIECLLATGVPFDVANETDIGRLAARRPRTVVVPLAYGLPDTAVAGLRALASAGTTVILSGDPAVLPDGTRRAERLRDLCGVRETGAAGQYAGLPRPAVVAGAARPLKLLGEFEAYRHAVGKGAVLYVPTPWEMLPDSEPFLANPEVTGRPDRNLYVGLLRAAGVQAPAPFRAAQGLWRTAVTPAAGGGRLVTVLPRGAARETGVVTLGGAAGGFSVRPAPGLPCALLLDSRGRPTAATGGGPLRMDGREVIGAPAPWMAVALDGRPLETAAALGITAMHATRVRWRSAGARPVAWVVEWRNGRAARVAPLRVRRVPGGWEAAVPAVEMVLVCPPGQEARWLRALWP